MTYLINKKIIVDDVTAVVDMGKYWLTNPRFIDGTSCRSYIDVVNVESIIEIDSFVDLM